MIKFYNIEDIKLAIFEGYIIEPKDDNDPQLIADVNAWLLRNKDRCIVLQKTFHPPDYFRIVNIFMDF